MNQSSPPLISLLVSNWYVLYKLISGKQVRVEQRCVLKDKDEEENEGEEDLFNRLVDSSKIDQLFTTFIDS